MKTQSKKKVVLVVFILLQKAENCNLFNKNCAQENVKCHTVFSMKKIDLDES